MASLEPVGVQMTTVEPTVTFVCTHNDGVTRNGAGFARGLSGEHRPDQEVRLVGCACRRAAGAAYEQRENGENGCGEARAHLSM